MRSNFGTLTATGCGSGHRQAKPLLDQSGLRWEGQAVAAALLANPADGRTLAEWGRNVGASGRTLARAFLAGTGMPFGQWRRLARLQAALPQLAAGQAVGMVARHVGYETPSAFVAAFRRETGLTPAAYFSHRGAPIVIDAAEDKPSRRGS